MNDGFLRFIKFFVILTFIAVLITLGAKAGFKMFQEKKYIDIETDLLLVQAKVKIIKGKSDVNSNTDAYVGTKVSESNNNDIKNILRKIGINENEYDKYFILYCQDIEKMGIANDLKNKKDEEFVVDYDTAEVIYTKGVKVNNQVKYKLSDIVHNVEKKDWILHNRMVE